ncbi:MAG TPA: tail fiber protein [Pyrinomonadaceae bacterium]|jgi:microcystin-dependent protein
MSQPFIGEIRLFAGTFEPAGWAFCDGRLLPISENDTLFVLLGTTYGGDGENTFALPDLRGRVPMHAGTGPGLSSRIIGEAGGVESVTLTTQQLPVHSHPAICVSGTNTGNAATPGGSVWAAQSSTGVYAAQPPTNPMNAGAMSAVGGSQPHDNMIPYLGINFIISLFGLFPQA